MNTPEEIKEYAQTWREVLVDDCIDFPYAVHTMLHTAADVVESLLTEIERLERERDAAVERLRGWCEVCVHWENEDSIAFCDGCTHNYPFEHETNFTDRWQWRGPEVE